MPTPDPEYVRRYWDAGFPPPGVPYWGEDPEYPTAAWKDAIANDATRHGYWHWVAMMRDQMPGDGQGGA